MDWHSSPYPISDIRDWRNNDKLELQPDFQRREVWSEAAKVMLIDTILKNIPIPKIYLKAIIKNDSTYRIVIDGQQRMTAILDFLDDKLILDKPYEGAFSGFKFSDFNDFYRNEFLRYKIDVNEIVNPTDDEVRDLYSRVNKYTVQLNRQELRRADYPGEFIKLAEILVNEIYFEESKVFTYRMTRRMLDVEFVEELLIIILEGIQEKKEIIDQFCKKYSVFEKGIDNVKAEFMKVLHDISIIFDKEEFPIAKTRYRQKADFYSLFAAIDDMHKIKKTIDRTKLNILRKELRVLDEKIAPHAEESEYSEYAVRCLSDANSLASRKWRKDYLLKFIQKAYSEEA